MAQRTYECDECGARYAAAGDSCMQRFHELLALDHSRQEPWGSRHLQAFAAFALQHPRAYGESLDAAWDVLYRIYCLKEPPDRVTAARRRAPDAPPLSARPAQRSAAFTVTIADLGSFAAATYPAQLDAWCRSAVSAWGAPVEH
jgi:hypothetical protein